MEEEYNPTRREIFQETGNIMKGWFNKNFNKKNLKDFGKKCWNVAVALNIVPYVLPTTIRESINAKKTKTEINNCEGIGSLSGFIAGAAGVYGQYKGYEYIADQGHSEVWWIPAITNSLSLVYEIGRGIYKKAENRLIEKHTKDLESTASQ